MERNVTDDSSKSQWVPLADAIKRVMNSSRLDLFAATDLIEHGLVSAKVRARGRLPRPIDGRADRRKLQSHHAPSDAQHKELGEQFWKKADRFSSNIHEELLFGIPVAIVMSEGPDFEIDDLEVHASTLRQWLLHQGSVSISPSQRGNHPKEHAWTFLISRLIELTRENGLRMKDYPEDTDLLRAIRRAWADDELRDRGDPLMDDTPDVLDNRSIRSILKAVWSEVVKDH
jgi:hypothetical protein